MRSQADGPGEPVPGLPVINGSWWFECENRPFVLRIECPLAFEEMVAALYGVALAEDMTSDEALCGSVGVTLLIEGLDRVRERAGKIRREEQRGAITSPAFLALCRRRVEALLGP